MFGMAITLMNSLSKTGQSTLPHPMTSNTTIRRNRLTTEQPTLHPPMTSSTASRRKPIITKEPAIHPPMTTSAIAIRTNPSTARQPTLHHPTTSKTEVIECWEIFGRRIAKGPAPHSFSSEDVIRLGRNLAQSSPAVKFHAMKHMRRTRPTLTSENAIEMAAEKAIEYRWVVSTGKVQVKRKAEERWPKKLATKIIEQNRSEYNAEKRTQDNAKILAK